ncbi:DUF1823 family protein [Acaryochloris marina]|uniref:DUF1823 domain-containing protein n=1 Tax=Acaryochloris marina (strain MBIC 11017) TaxID=329726 RepID=B0CAB2_ACAM1|nr:DUF1823 family protein [Acaryochloris marina]ABW27847.1 conserved hypothetical protein [Acaryochloris marina MBIC11017]BDM82573.1 hypothetical protein AM10699_54340 [Acaryochloris marina MBIC10699]
MSVSESDLPELIAETFWAILDDKIPDEIVNQMLWYHLGYRYDPASQAWDVSQVDEVWTETYPDPPDFIGSRPATIKLTRSIPKENKQLLKSELGFGGYTVDELNPRRTRRATAVNWFLNYLKQSAASNTG